jgi:putative DNA primase/helicase
MPITAKKPGIRDWGVGDQPGEKREGKRTPVDIVREYLNLEFAEAVAWLRARLGLEEEKASSLLLDPTNPMPSARKIVALHFTNENKLRTLQRHRHAFWWHQNSHYRLTDDETLRARIWEVLESAYRETKEGKTAPFKPTSARVSEVLDALRAVTQLNEHINPPAWLNSEPAPAEEFFACTNGLLHLPSGKLYTATPEYFGLSASEVIYDPAAQRPVMWLQFLNEVLADDQAINAVQEWFGYTLAPDTSQQKILLAIGPKRSGKGTLARILTKLSGSASVAGPTMNSLGAQFGLEGLITKSLAIISDARIGRRTETSLIVERLLSISGEDGIDVARKYAKAWSGRLLTRIMILTNELPSLTDGSGALASRFILILFPNSFYGKEDITLTDRLTTELSGILNWAIAGYRRLKQRGYFVQPENAKEQLDTIEMLGAPVKAFIRDCCEVGPGFEEEVDTLYEAWEGWCQLQRRPSGTKEWFGRNLHSAIPGLRIIRPAGEGAARPRRYVGVRLAQHPVWGAATSAT